MSIYVVSSYNFACFRLRHQSDAHGARYVRQKRLAGFQFVDASHLPSGESGVVGMACSRSFGRRAGDCSPLFVH